jgi:Polyketide cyclase / dehydrase and lipid transport
VKKGTTSQVQNRVDASPEVIYDLVTDVTRMGEWSPECVGCEWIDGANGPVPGARFRGRNRHRLARWSTRSRVLMAHRPGEFTFVAGDAFGRDLTVWTYRFAAAQSGTEVTESFALLRDIPWYIRFWRRSFMGVSDRKADLEANMRRTLLHLKVAAESH